MEILETERRHLEETLAIVRDELRKTQQALGMENGEDRMVMAQDDGSSDSVVALSRS